MTDNAVYEIRRLNLERLLVERGAKTMLAIRLDVTQARVSHMLKAPGDPGHRDINEDTARRIEEEMGLTRGSLDVPHGEMPVSRALHDTAALIEESVKVVINAVTDAHSKVVADKTAGVVRMVFENSLPTGKVDPSFVAQLVKLMR